MDRNAYQREWCSKNREKMRAYHRAWYRKNAEDMRARSRKFHREHKEYYYKKQKEWASKNPEKVAASRKKLVAKNKERARALRAKMLSDHGGKCVTCGFSDSRALQIDHINGGGKRHRKTFNSGSMYYQHLSKCWDDSKYQILCANCNQIKKITNNEY